MPPEASPGRPIPTRHRRVSRLGQRSLSLSPLPGRSSPLFSAFQARCQGSAHSPWALRPARGEGAQPRGVGLARRSPADVCGTDESIMGERGGCACLGIRWDGSVLEARSRQREPGPEGEPRPDSSGSRRLPASPGLRPRRSGPCLCGHAASSSSAVQPPSCKDTREDAGPTQTIRDPLPTPRSLPPFPRQSPSAVDGDSHGFWDQEGDVWWEGTVCPPAGLPGRASCPQHTAQTSPRLFRQTFSMKSRVVNAVGPMGRVWSLQPILFLNNLFFLKNNISKM